MRHRVRIGMSRTSTGAWSGDSTIECDFSDEEGTLKFVTGELKLQSIELSDWVRAECVRRTKEDKGV